ncbi:MAG: flagellar basal body rod protein FlgB [Gammaproteobacteria bacterium]
MFLNLDTVFGIHEQALKLQAQRAEVLANNIANIDTPKFLARDFDFHQILRNEQEGGQLTLATTSTQHIGQSDSITNIDLQYRIPLQASLDGNTVDPQLEQAAFVSNSLAYQASLNFIEGSASGIRKALSSEA